MIDSFVTCVWTGREKKKKRRKPCKYKTWAAKEIVKLNKNACTILEAKEPIANIETKQYKRAICLIYSGLVHTLCSSFRFLPHISIYCFIFYAQTPMKLIGIRFWVCDWGMMRKGRDGITITKCIKYMIIAAHSRLHTHTHFLCIYVLFKNSAICSGVGSLCWITFQRRLLDENESWRY